jgi:indolepyruvate ferredoxin oxidoreductase alpha subunit
MCPGCTHRGIFHVLKQLDLVISGDIGCYTLGFAPPYNAMDTCLCMGGAFSVAHGMQKAFDISGQDKRAIGVLGDSTFFHMGINSLMEVIYNESKAICVILDNHTTGMTGHQEHPGSGKTLMGEETVKIDIADMGRACGVKNVKIVNPLDIHASLEVLKEATESKETWMVVSEAPCPLQLRSVIGPPLTIKEDDCTNCGVCLDLGCPGIEKYDEKIKINELLCAGCKMCQSICAVDAIVELKK